MYVCLCNVCMYMYVCAVVTSTGYSNLICMNAAGEGKVGIEYVNLDQSGSAEACKC